MNFHSGKKGRFGGFDNQRIKSDSQSPKDKTWPKFCCTVLLTKPRKGQYSALRRESISRPRYCQSKLGTLRPESIVTSWEVLVSRSSYSLAWEGAVVPKSYTVLIQRWTTPRALLTFLALKDDCWEVTAATWFFASTVDKRETRTFWRQPPWALGSFLLAGHSTLSSGKRHKIGA